MRLDFTIMPVRSGANAVICGAVLAAFGCMQVAAQTNVLTYHNDTLRTGWNANETALTVASVSSGNFTLQHAVVVDDQVDAQPLFVSGQRIAGQRRKHDVVYVATENNTVYAIDAATGTILLHRNLGVPVPQSALPGQCNNNGPNIGINSTPAISTASQTMWLITYTYQRQRPAFRLHALDLATLADKVPPVVVTAAAPLADGSVYKFNPAVSRQRSALLFANQAIYAGFGSFCDFDANLSRGWMLGWKAKSLRPFSSNLLTNKNTSAPKNRYLSSVWMSGAGPATLGSKSDIFFATGNSDPSGTTYNPTSNLSESVVRMSSNLSTVEDYFTPSTVANLDIKDLDLGSGGVMLLPPQPSDPANLMIAGGKDPHTYLLNADNLGQYNPTTNNVLGTYSAGDCWCAPAYFTGSDGVGRVVTSSGTTAIVWRLNTSSTPSLVRESTSAVLSTGQAPGFFTSVSSNGSVPGTAIIWAVSHPKDSNPANVTLYAFDASDSATLFSDIGGSWPNVQGNANIVPTIANGRVFVGSNRELAIFGLGGAAPASELNQLLTAQQTALMEASSLPVLTPGEHAIYGTVVAVGSGILTLQKRDGVRVQVDTSEAQALNHAAVSAAGSAAFVRGNYLNGVLVATYISHAKPQPALWKPDR